MLARNTASNCMHQLANYIPIDDVYIVMMFTQDIWLTTHINVTIISIWGATEQVTN